MREWRNVKRMEYFREKFLSCAKLVEDDEALRLATTYEVKVSLEKMHHYSAYLQGARTAFMMMHERYKAKKGEDAVYTDAVFRLITSDLRYTGMFMFGGYDIYYRNHKRDKRGKLVSVEAYFGERVSVLREV